MDFPGLDVKSLTDDEIYKRIGELTAKLMFVHHTSGNRQMIEQLDAILETLHFEQSERSGKRQWEKESNDNPVVVETDPELAPENRKAQVKKTSTGPGANAPFIPKRTKAPTSNG
jgi:carboxylesterase type B